MDFYIPSGSHLNGYNYATSLLVWPGSKLFDIQLSSFNCVLIYLHPS